MITKNILIEFILILLSMIFCNIIADYGLQGIKKDLKCKSYWGIYHPENLYKNDYKTALLTHSFEWTFTVFIPLILYLLYRFYDLFMNINLFMIVIFLFISNITIHYNIDDLKANKKLINLKKDQICHILQILLTWTVVLSLILGK